MAHEVKAEKLVNGCKNTELGSSPSLPQVSYLSHLCYNQCLTDVETKQEKHFSKHLEVPVLLRKFCT